MWVIGLLFSTGLGVYWAAEMVMGVPDAFRGEHRAANVLVSIAGAMVCASHLVLTMRWRLILVNASLVSILAAFCFAAFGGK